MQCSHFPLLPRNSVMQRNASQMIVITVGSSDWMSSLWRTETIELISICLRSAVTALALRCGLFRRCTTLCRGALRWWKSGFTYCTFSVIVTSAVAILEYSITYWSSKLLPYLRHSTQHAYRVMLNYTGEYCEYGEYCNARDA